MAAHALSLQPVLGTPALSSSASKPGVFPHLTAVISEYHERAKLYAYFPPVWHGSCLVKIGSGLFLDFKWCVGMPGVQMLV